jgi:molybdopterin molybdotransferase
VSVEVRPGRAAEGPMLRLEEALERMLEGVEPLPAEGVELAGAQGRILAASLASRLTLPPWDNSAMDGFAIRAVDVVGATPARPVRLAVSGEAAAGRPASAGVAEGEAVRILTGAPLPPGADAVVPLEDTDTPPGAADLPDSVAVLVPAAVGAHVRRRGSDLRAGYPLLPAGTALDPAALALAAATGHGSVTVHRRPRVAVLATGDELSAAGAELGPAQIPDSNSVGLGAQAAEAGAEVRMLGIAADRLDDVLRHLEVGLAWADVIVVSGGVSVGAHDVVKEAFERVGQMELWRVAVQPGKPLAFGRARSGGEGANDVLLFGLPGNPVSSFVTFELFVRPVVRRLAGHTDLSGRQVIRARLTEPATKAAGRRAFLRVRLTPVDERDRLDGKPAWEASLAGGQGSHVLSALALADGLAVVGEDDDSLPAGAEVDVISLRHVARPSPDRGT